LHQLLWNFLEEERVLGQDDRAVDVCAFVDLGILQLAPGDAAISGAGAQLG
jgi:hypothetical protein